MMTKAQARKLLTLSVGFWLLTVLFVAHPALGILVACVLAFRHHGKKRTHAEINAWLRAGAPPR